MGLLYNGIAIVYAGGIIVKRATVAKYGIFFLCRARQVLLKEVFVCMKLYESAFCRLHD